MLNDCISHISNSDEGIKIIRRKHCGTAGLEIVCLFEHYTKCVRVKNHFKKNNFFNIFLKANLVIADPLHSESYSL